MFPGQRFDVSDLVLPFMVKLPRFDSIDRPMIRKPAGERPVAHHSTILGMKTIEGCLPFLGKMHQWNDVIGHHRGGPGIAFRGPRIGEPHESQK